MAMSKSGASSTATTGNGTSTTATRSRSKPAAAATVTCQAVVTTKGKPGRCDQPATANRLSASGGHAVCLKHDRAVWIEYVKAGLPSCPSA
jgi:hypothetical protein